MADSTMVKLILSMLLLFCSTYAQLKECTNTPTHLSSHTSRFHLLSSQNQTLKHDMFSHHHLNPSVDSSWAELLPRTVFQSEEEEFGWLMEYRRMKHSMVFRSWDEHKFLKEFSLDYVRLSPGSIHWRAQQTNLEYLLMLDVDRLVWSFRRTAGLKSVGSPYGGWEAPDCELRGHFVGHYLSATSKMWASTHNDTIKANMVAVVSALGRCQKNIGTGYLSAFPSEFFDRFEAIKLVWAPYYTIHKILAGLLDQYMVAGNDQALQIAIRMVEYFYNRVRKVILEHTIERHWQSLNEETGGMNDVLYKLYSITKVQKHLLLAHLFDKPCFLGLLALKVDSLSNFHANTHIPLIVGAQMRYEVTGDPIYMEIGQFFMDTINSSHSYATGGTSVQEFWRNPRRLATTLSNETEESCTTYNMLKVSRHLFMWTKESTYGDYYERALTNGVLSIQRGTQPGVMIYMLPLGRGTSKAHTYHGWGTTNQSFWCCYGTAIESFSKLGDSIYFEEAGKDGILYIIQYISSLLFWRSKGVIVNQNVKPVVSWDSFIHVNFTFSSNKGTSELLSSKLRMPIWSSLLGAEGSLSGQKVHLQSPGTFLTISVRSNDSFTMKLPIILRTEAIKDDRPEYSSIHAILFGPYLLAAFSSSDWRLGVKTESPSSLWLTPVPPSHNSQLVSISQKHGGVILVLMSSRRAIISRKLPGEGTDSAVHATFRAIPLNHTPPSPRGILGREVKLEPFSLPGMVVVHKGRNRGISVGENRDGNTKSVFVLVQGLDGEIGSVSFESADVAGCFLRGGRNDGEKVTLGCRGVEGEDEGFEEEISFVMSKGFREYHPISFVAKGVERGFLLSPLMSLRDESYTVYFKFLH